MSLSVSGFFLLALVLVGGFWLGKNKPNLLGGVI